EVVQRVSALEKEVIELKQVDHSTKILASIRSQVPPVVDKYLGSTLGDTLQKEQAAQEKVPKFSSTPYDQQADEEHKQKEILFKMMISSKSYERHPAHKALYDALPESIFVDENDMDRLDESTKGNTPPKTSKNRKFVHAEETVEEATHKVTLDVEEPTQEKVENNIDQPQSNDAPKTSKIPNKDWFKQPLRPPTPDPEWNTVRTISDEPEQTWFKDLMRAEKPPLTFDERMATPIDFSKCRSSHLTVVAEYFFNNDLEYLKPGSEERNYTTSITKTKAAKYDLKFIEDMIPNQWSPLKVGYNKDAAFRISHWVTDVDYGTDHRLTSSLHMMSTQH
nr:hypothetical protein [Tanacetum cinerariifolium]